MSIIQHDPLISSPMLAPAALCPSWCTGHDVVDEPDGSRLVIHRGTVVDDAAGYRVALRSTDTTEPDGRTTYGRAHVVLDSDALSPSGARHLLAALALAAELAAGGVR